jgi:hypothetical protein
MKLWKPKLHKWKSFIEELHKAYFAFDEEGNEAEIVEKVIEKVINDKGPVTEI